MAPDPSCLYCIEQGGSIQIIKTSRGEIAICSLPDGTRSEAWTLYRKAKNYSETMDPLFRSEIEKLMGNT